MQWYSSIITSTSYTQILKKAKLLFYESHLKYVNVKRITLEKSLRELKTLTDSHRKNSSRIQQPSCSHSCHLYFYHTWKQKQIAIKISSKHSPPPANSAVLSEIPTAPKNTDRALPSVRAHSELRCQSTFSGTAEINLSTSGKLIRD